MTTLYRTLFSRARCPRRRFSYLPCLEDLGERCLLSASGFLQTNIISDVPGLAGTLDPSLANPWGMSSGAMGPFWFADNSSGVSTLGGETGLISPSLTVAIPDLTGGATNSTGTVFNGGNGFAVSDGTNSGPSMFLFATEQGTILGWNPTVNLDQAVVAVDNSATSGLGPVYTGLTLADTNQGTFLYAANFRAGTIDVFNSNFQQINQPGIFADPKLPSDFVPFNVQVLGSSVYVTYTKSLDGNYSGTGLGDGFVDVFSTQGQLENRLISGGSLDASWGVAMAPANFGQFSNDVLVGNFGDGRIDAFDPHSGAYLGTLTDSSGQAIEIPQLWALSFGNNDLAGPSGSLYFTSGIGFEEHGLFGSLQANAPGVIGGLTSAQQNVMTDIEHEAPGPDSYPLPPGDGPTLSQTIIAPQNLPVSLVSLRQATLVMAPTLLAPANESSNAAPLVNTASSPAGPNTPAPFLNSANSAADGANPANSVVSIPGLNVLLDLAATRRSADSEIRPVNSFSDVPGFVAPQAFDEQGVSRDYLADNPTGHVATAAPDAVTSETAKAIARNASEAGGHLSSLPHYLVLFVISLCGIHFAGSARRRPSEFRLSVFSSLWSRLTHRLGSTMFSKAKVARPSEQTPTRVITNL